MHRRPPKVWESLTKQTPEAPLKWSKSKSSTLLFSSLKIDTRNIVSKCTGNLCLQLNNLSDFMLCTFLENFYLSRFKVLLHWYVFQMKA